MNFWKIIIGALGLGAIASSAKQTGDSSNLSQGRLDEANYVPPYSVPTAFQQAGLHGRGLAECNEPMVMFIDVSASIDAAKNILLATADVLEGSNPSNTAILLYARGSVFLIKFSDASTVAEKIAGLRALANDPAALSELRNNQLGTTTRGDLAISKFVAERGLLGLDAGLPVDVHFITDFMDNDGVTGANRLKVSVDSLKNYLTSEGHVAQYYSLEVAGQDGVNNDVAKYAASNPQNVVFFPSPEGFLADTKKVIDLSCTPGTKPPSNLPTSTKTPSRSPSKLPTSTKNPSKLPTTQPTISQITLSPSVISTNPPVTFSPTTNTTEEQPNKNFCESNLYLCIPWWAFTFRWKNIKTKEDALKELELAKETAERQLQQDRAALSELETVSPVLANEMVLAGGKKTINLSEEREQLRANIVKLLYPLAESTPEELEARKMQLAKAKHELAEFERNNMPVTAQDKMAAKERQNKFNLHLESLEKQAAEDLKVTHFNGAHFPEQTVQRGGFLGGLITHPDPRNMPDTHGEPVVLAREENPPPRTQTPPPEKPEVVLERRIMASHLFISLACVLIDAVSNKDISRLESDVSKNRFGRGVNAMINGVNNLFGRPAAEVYGSNATNTAPATTRGRTGSEMV